MSFELQPHHASPGVPERRQMKTVVAPGGYADRIAVNEAEEEGEQFDEDDFDDDFDDDFEDEYDEYDEDLLEMDGEGLDDADGGAETEDDCDEFDDSDDSNSDEGDEFEEFGGEEFDAEL